MALLAQRLQALTEDGVKINPATANPGEPRPTSPRSLPADTFGVCGRGLRTARSPAGMFVGPVQPAGTAQTSPCTLCPVGLAGLA